MTNTGNTGTKRGEEAALLTKSLPGERQPWTFFYRTGEIIRELRKALRSQADREGEEGSGGGLPSSEQVLHGRYDEEASLRMDDEGCPNERTATLAGATGYYGTRGELLLAA